MLITSIQLVKFEQCSPGCWIDAQGLRDPPFPCLGLVTAFSIFITTQPDTSNIFCTWCDFVSAQSPQCLLNKRLPRCWSMFKRFIFHFAEWSPREKQTLSSQPEDPALADEVASSKNILIHHLLKWTQSLGRGLPCSPPSQQRAAPGLP